MTELKFKRRNKLSDAWNEKGITIKICPDYKRQFFSKRCRLEKECKNAKKIRRTLINQRTQEVTINSHHIECNGRMLVCNNCKREFMTKDEAATCYFNHGVKLTRRENKRVG